MRNDLSTLERLRSRASSRRVARRERRALETYLAQDSLSPNARQELEVILFRQGVSV
ncbi:hypothetical protein I6A84_04330 [Frankia sp. CNm7]|uniref:Uncharacterized protein n=1 Tax=Frankia nepalensis TaxID=1836974 RepID=A0A937UTD0_9ACTN|nr:hypothetical protein [Frankia nepalensis]MBL7501999.1 hypothetical protein [Frankia nepalensis]MBL7510629.1 hypothetical protein [Frankia nepalensis]MBL7517369.1 hypothetical protein [Frankia nepalensis]MBL7633452.1 hypothetical protein [Frankia nepalensis]